MSLQFVQAKKTTLQTGISAAETTEIVLKKLVDIYGNELALSDFGTILYLTIDPGGSTEEIISATGFTVNADDTVSLNAGITRGLAAKSPYTTGGTASAHAAGVTVVVSNNPQLYASLVTLTGSQTIAGIKTFSSVPVTTGGNPINPNDLARKAYVDAVVLGALTSLDVVVPGTAGATVVLGSAIYLDVTDGEWKLCDADTAATVENVELGVALGAGSDGNPILNGVCLRGKVTGLSGLTIGKQYASNTAGEFSPTPGTKEVTLGYASSATELLFVPRYDQQITEDQQDALVGTSGTAPSSANKFVDNSDTGVTGANKVLRLNGSGALDPSILPTTLVSTSTAGEALTALEAVAAGWYQADGGVKFDAKAGAAGSGTSLGGPTITVGNNANRIIIITVVALGQAISNVTVGGVAATQIDAGNSAGGSATCYYFTGYVLAPATGAVTLAATIAGSVAFAWTAHSYYNAKQTSPIDVHVLSAGNAVTGTVTNTPTALGTLLYGYYGASKETVATIVGIPKNIQAATQAGIYLSTGDNGQDPSLDAQTMSFSGATNTYGNIVGGVAILPATAPTYDYVVKASANNGSAFTQPLAAPNRINFVGFVTNSPNVTEVATVQTTGVVTGLSGLTPLKPYYLSDTLGAISAVAGTNSRKIGIALSATKLLITNTP